MLTGVEADGLELLAGLTGPVLVCDKRRGQNNR